MSKPNILYIHSHDTGRYIQPYGYDVATPNMQKLAEQGVLFRQNFCAAPTCSPSRACLVTGQAAHSSGMYGLAHRGFSLFDYSQHVVHTVRKAGYKSTLIGVQHVAADPNIIGYDNVVDTPTRRVCDVAPAAVDFISQPHKEPFWLTVGFQETHREYPVPGDREDPRYTLPPAPLPDTPETRYDMACFKTSAREYDRGVGMVLDALEANGLANNTLVINTTDHGIAFPGMKCNLTDHGIGVMLIMRGPGGFSGGQICDELVSHIDIFPTVCDLVGIEQPDWLQGESLIPLVTGKIDSIHDAIYADVTYHAAYEPKRCIRTKRWKYIRRFDGRETPVLPNCDDGPSKSLWLEHGWRDRCVDQEQLYDLAFDPNEAHNLVNDPTMRPLLAEMRRRLTEWMQDTDDPLLSGPLEPPAGAYINDADGVSPKDPGLYY